MVTFQAVVLKFGTNSLVKGNGQKLNYGTVENIARNSSLLLDAKVTPVLVISGALASGMERENLDCRPDELPERRRLAAVGSLNFWTTFSEAFAAYGLATAYVPVTLANLEREAPYMGSFAAYCANNRTVTLWNCNDAILNPEQMADNDPLAAGLATQLQADLYIFTDQGIMGTGGAASKQKASEIVANYNLRQHSEAEFRQRNKPIHLRFVGIDDLESVCLGVCKNSYALLRGDI